MGFPFPEIGIPPGGPLSYFHTRLWWGGSLTLSWMLGPHVPLMDFPGPLASLSPLLSEYLCCLRAYPELGKERKKEIIFKWDHSVTMNTPDWWGERMEMGMVQGCFPFRSLCKRKENMPRNVRTAWACLLSPWCHVVEWENCCLWLLQMKVNICPGLTVCQVLWQDILCTISFDYHKAQWMQELVLAPFYRWGNKIFIFVARPWENYWTFLGW